MRVRRNTWGFIPVNLVVMLVLIVIALAMIGFGAEAMRVGCPARALYLFAGGALFFGIGGSASAGAGILKITGPPAIVLAAVAAFMQGAFGWC